MRVTALVMVALIASMSGSLAVTSEPNDADITKMSEELISELSSEGHIEAIVPVSYTHLRAHETR